MNTVARETHTLKLHKFQKLVMASKARFRVVVAGRRWGKTQIAKISCVIDSAKRPSRIVWYVAPTYQQARDIFWEDLKASIPRAWIRKINETRMVIHLVNNSRIHCKGADKPDCYDDETEILTVEGWCKIAKLPPGLAVMTLNPDTNEAEWQVPVRHIHEPYKGEMRRVLSDKLDLLVTPNHRFLVDTRKGARKFKTLDEMAHQDRIPASVNWTGTDDDDLSDDWMAFLGFYLAEGCARKNPGPKKSYEITFAQTPGVKGGDKGDVRSEFIGVLQRLGLSYHEHADMIRVYDRAAWKRVVHLGTAWEKRIPEEILDLPPAKLEILLRWMILGDGLMRRGRYEALYTTSKGMADDVQELCMKIGRSARVHEKTQNGGALKDGCVITPRRPLYQVSIFNNRYNYLRDTKENYVSTVHYDGMVHCVEVPNHTVYVRRNGKACWSGNSLRGVGLHFVVIDEAQDIKEETWELVLQPTLATTNGRALFIGTPKSFNWLYYKYMLGQRPRKVPDHRGRLVDNEWESWQFPTITSPFIPKSEIEARRRDMDPKSFRQEFEACHLPETEILMWDGTIKPIRDVRKGDAVRHLTEYNEIVPAEVLQVGETGEKVICDVVLETGEVISASAHHKFKVYDYEAKHGSSE